MEKNLNSRNRPNQKHILRKNGSLDIGTVNEEPTLTQQQYKESSDVNNIIKQYSETGVLPTHNKVAQFLDVSNIADYQQSLQTVFEAQKAFDSLPSHVRTRFENDPNKLLDFMSQTDNYDEALSLGLVNPKIQNEQTQTNEIKKQKQEAPTSKSSSPSSDKSDA